MVDRVGFNPPSFGGEQPPERPVRFGANEMQAEDEFVRVARKELAAEAVQYKKMEVPWLDYLTNRFDVDDANAFIKQVYAPPGVDGEISGLDFLNLLMSPEAIDPYNPPQEPARLNYADYAVPETKIREGVEAKGLPGYFYDELLNLAHREGLIFELTDTENGRTYYGVPAHVRDALGLEPEEKKEVVAEVATESGRGEQEALKEALVAYGKKAAELDDREMLDYVAELLQSARKDGLIEFEEIPESIRGIDVDPEFLPTLSNALVTLLDTAPGTELFEATRELAQKAVEAGKLDPNEYELAG